MPPSSGGAGHRAAAFGEAKSLRIAVLSLGSVGETRQEGRVRGEQQGEGGETLHSLGKCRAPLMPCLPGTTLSVFEGDSLPQPNTISIFSPLMILSFQNSVLTGNPAQTLLHLLISLLHVRNSSRPAATPEQQPSEAPGTRATAAPPPLARDRDAQVRPPRAGSGERPPPTGAPSPFQTVTLVTGIGVDVLFVNLK